MPSNTVMVVEDDALLRLEAVLLLEEAGLQVVEFSNADEALAFAHDNFDQIAAIFTDIQMPGYLNGLELADIVSRHWPHILVLIISGRLQPIEPLQSNVRYMRKPWRPLQVLTMMQDAAQA